MTGAVTTGAELATIAVALGAGLRWLYRAITRVERTVKLVEARSTQLLPDSGGSLRDDVTAIKNTVALHSTVLARQDQVMAAQGDALARTDQAVCRLAARIDTLAPPAPTAPTSPAAAPGAPTTPTRGANP